jgi:hypothetical protein
MAWIWTFDGIEAAWVCVNRTSKWARLGSIDENGLSHGFLLKRGTRVDVKGTKGFRLFFSFFFLANWLPTKSSSSIIPYFICFFLLLDSMNHEHNYNIEFAAWLSAPSVQSNFSFVSKAETYLYQLFKLFLNLLT